MTDSSGSILSPVVAMGTPVLDVQNLRVRFGRGPQVVDGISFELKAGECLGIVGESGSGKSVTARSLIGLAGTGAHVETDHLRLGERSLMGLRPATWRGIRGREIGFILQDALSSLDPLRPVGREIADALRLHTRLSPAARGVRVQELLTAVGMPEPHLRARQRSGELSGGLRQRALIASAIALNPPVLIADEPTTALDATVQAQVLELLAQLTASGAGLLLISHDLAVVKQLADRVAVMRAGRIVESGSTAEILEAPQHDYTRSLIAAVPTGRPRGERLSVSSSPLLPTTMGALGAQTRPHEPPVEPEQHPVLDARRLTKVFRTPDRNLMRAVDDVSLTLHPGRTLGLVGESGSGKTTVARLLLALETPDHGTVTLHGEPWSPLPESARRHRRQQIGAIYQDPSASFDPRLTVEQILTDAAGNGSGGTRRHHTRVAELLDSVGLASRTRDSRPAHLSGGQRQRVAIARALAPRPGIIICDEPVSALDVTVQAQVLDLLNDLQQEFAISYLFISHDLGVVGHMSDSLLVMRGGRIVERGDTEAVFRSPAHQYTSQLLAAAPRL